VTVLPTKKYITLLSLLILAGVGSPLAQTTQIYDTMSLARDACTISIDSEDLILCPGDEINLSADLVCGDGYLQVADPQWHLDGEPIATGNDLNIALPLGTYTLLVTCGSCDDQISIDVVADCPRRPRLIADFADEEIAKTTGIFITPNETAVTGVTFPYLRYNMRPVTLDTETPQAEGVYRLFALGDNLELYTQAGVPVSLPAFFDGSELPVTLLINASDYGTSELVAVAEEPVTDQQDDRIVVRAGQFPGLAGGALPGYPSFEFVAAINTNDNVETAIDPVRHLERLELPYRVYIVEHKTPAQWAADNSLSDVTFSVESSTVTAGSIADNTVTAWSLGLNGGNSVGKPYDVIYDFGQDGQLDPGDLIDGLSETEAGFYAVRDLVSPGPHNTTTINYYGGTWLSQRTYYPSDIASLGEVPLVVISHGNGHQYTWYDYLGEHLASYGYIVMSHSNNTQPGIESASTTTLTNTDYIVGNLATIGGGVLNGHLDSHRIAWIGHSRGGEGVVRAYDRIHDNTYTPSNYVTEDIVCVSSIAPTVYLSTITQSNPHESNYHLITGAADGDVNGGVHDYDRQSLRLIQAARGNIQVTYVHGAGHNDFNCCGWNDATGPDLIGRTEAQRVAKGYYVALIETYTRNNIAAREYFTRMYETLRPAGIADHVIVAGTYRDAVATDRFVIDDYQSGTSIGTSSSGGAVTYNVTNIYEGHLDDGNLTFTWMASDPMNGMSQAESVDAFAGGVVFDWASGSDLYYELAVVPGQQDFRDHRYLSFRSCQGTRHPNTLALYDYLSYSVTLRDADGVSSPIDFGVFSGLTHPYRRTGYGTGIGWGNEFSTVRIRLCDFENNGSGIDLSRIEAVRFEFGAPHGSDRGRIGLDDVELTRN
jgi:Cutinase